MKSQTLAYISVKVEKCYKQYDGKIFYNSVWGVDFGHETLGNY